MNVRLTDAEYVASRFTISVFPNTLPAKKSKSIPDGTSMDNKLTKAGPGWWAATSQSLVTKITHLVLPSQRQINSVVTLPGYQQYYLEELV